MEYIAPIIADSGDDIAYETTKRLMAIGTWAKLDTPRKMSTGVYHYIIRESEKAWVLHAYQPGWGKPW